MNWPTKKLGNIFLFVILVVIVLTPFIYVYYSKPDKSFWDNTMGNMLATVLALVGGIPIALWIDRLIKSKEEQGNEIIGPY